MPDDIDFPQISARTSGVLCPKCGGACGVTDSRPVEGAHRRRRKCMTCGHRFTTYETRQKEPLLFECIAIVKHIDMLIEALANQRRKLQFLMDDLGQFGVAPDERLAGIMELRALGKTYTEIGDQFGISAQLVHQILQSAQGGAG